MLRQITLKRPKIALPAPKEPLSQSGLQIAVGERLRAARDKKALRQEDLAAAIDIDRPEISKIESGKKNLTLGTMVKFCRGLDITLSDLLKGLT